MDNADRSVVDALSWRLASELTRRHPGRLFVANQWLADGLYDCLVVWSADGCRIVLNRNGTIQVHGVSGGSASRGWEMTTWETYMRSNPREFVDNLQIAAGLSPPSKIPPSTPTALTYRLLATLSALSVKSADMYGIGQGFIDADPDYTGLVGAGDAMIDCLVHADFVATKGDS